MFFFLFFRLINYFHLFEAHRPLSNALSSSHSLRICSTVPCFSTFFHFSLLTCFFMISIYIYNHFFFLNIFSVPTIVFLNTFLLCDCTLSNSALSCLSHIFLSIFHSVLINSSSKKDYYNKLS